MRIWSSTCLLIGCGLLSSCAVDETKQASPATPETAAVVKPTEQATQPEERGPGGVTRMPLGTLFHLQQANDVLLYDVRPGFYFRMGHIPGAVNWPRSAYSSQLTTREQEIQQAVAAGKKIVLYCTDLACPDARRVAYQLAERGHHVTVLEGGMEAWRAGELPVE